MRKNVTQYRLPTGTNFSNPAHLDQLNKMLQNLGDRLDTIQQVGAKAPAAPLGVAVQAKQGVFSLTWKRVTNCDGYIVCWSGASGLVPLSGRYTLHDSEAANYRLPVGNAVVTYYFTVSAFVGNQVSPPSVSVSATSSAFTSVEAAPLDAPVTPRAALVSPPRNGTTLA